VAFVSIQQIEEKTPIFPTSAVFIPVSYLHLTHPIAGHGPALEVVAAYHAKNLSRSNDESGRETAQISEIVSTQERLYVPVAYRNSGSSLWQIHGTPKV
jgi:hypothetical protein